MNAAEFYSTWDDIFEPDGSDNLRKSFKFAEDYARFYGQRLLEAEMKLLEFRIAWEEGKGYRFIGDTYEMP